MSGCLSFAFCVGYWGIHSEKDCLSVVDVEERNCFKWGLWLKASPRKGRGHQVQEVESLKSAKQMLFVPKDSGTTSSMSKTKTDQNVRDGDEVQTISAGKKKVDEISKNNVAETVDENVVLIVLK